MRSAERVFDLYEHFADVQEPLSLSELARGLSMPVSTCFNLVRAFERRGFLYSADARRGLYPTKRMLQLGLILAQNDPLGPVVTERLLKLRDETGETVVMSKRRDDHVVLLEVQESVHAIRYSARVGEVRPVEANSMGKALLSLMPQEELEAFVEGLKFKSLTKRTMRSAQEYLADIEASRIRGWFLNDGESSAELIAMAAPVRINSEEFAVAVAGPRSRLELKMDQCAAGLLETCQAIQASKNG